MHSAQAERGRAKMFDAADEGRVQLSRAAGSVDPPREQEGHALRLQTACRERHDGGRRRIEPLLVVDRDDQRRTGGKRPQHIEKPGRERAPVGRYVCRPQQQSDLECPPLRLRQARQGLLQYRLQQIDEARERQRSLDLHRPRHECPVAPHPRRRESLAPERRLADARLPLDQQRLRRPGPNPSQEHVDARELSLPADQCKHVLQRVPVTGRA